MANEVRLCNPYEINFLIEYDGVSKFKGFLSGYINQLLLSVSKTANITYKIRSINDGVGEKMSESSEYFTGCIGLLQRNQSDVLIRGITYPIKAADLCQGDIILDSRLQFMTAYSPRDSHESETVKIESCFNSFDSLLWLMCAFVVLFICALCQMRLSLRKEMIVLPEERRLVSRIESRYYTNFLYQVLTHMTKYGSMSCYSGCFNKVVFTTLSFACFMLLFYFGSMMKTELVVVKPPDVVRSYRDLLEKKIGISFLLATDSYLQFKFAPESSDEKRLWDMTRAKLNESEMLFSAESGRIASVLQPLFKRELSFFSESTWMPSPMKELCSIAFDQVKIDRAIESFNMPRIKAKSLFPFISEDEKSQELLKAFVFNRLLSPPVKRTRKALRHMFEMGIMRKVSRLVQELDLFDWIANIQPDKKRGDVFGPVKQCRENILFMEEIQTQKIRFENIVSLLRIVVCLCALALVALIAESYFHPNRKRASKGSKMNRLNNGTRRMKRVEPSRPGGRGRSNK